MQVRGVYMPYTLKRFKERFPDDAACLGLLMQERYGGTTFKCPSCKTASSRFHKIAARRAYACQNCGHHIYPCAGTLFEKSRAPLTDWFYAIHLVTNTPQGFTAKELQGQIGCTYKTAWRMVHEIRGVMAAASHNADDVAVALSKGLWNQIERLIRNEPKEDALPKNGHARKSAAVHIIVNRLEDDQGRLIIKLLRKIMQLLDTHSRLLLKKYDLTIPQVMCLYEVFEKNAITVVALAENIHLSTSTLVGIIDRLEEKKLVRRIRDKVDRRSVFVKITAKGHRFVTDTPYLLHNRLHDDLNGLTAKRQAMIVDSLNIISSLLGKGMP